MPIFNQTATVLKQQLDAGEISSAELTTQCFEQINSLNSSVGAFLSTREELALEEAKEIDRKRSANETVGILAGIPVAVKDLLCTKGETTTCASRMLESFKPPYSATAIERLKAEGAIIVGKTNLDEFAMGGSTENSALQTTTNPWSTDRVPGGSSGGAAACIAASMVPLSIGTDTGGSIRQPASFCGIVGLKPTYGRVSRYGLVAFASSLDQIGPLAWTVEDVALLLESIAGKDPRDSTSADIPAPAYTQSVKTPIEDLKIGVVREHLDGGLAPEVASSIAEAIRVYESLGAKIVDVALPHSKYAIAAYYIIAPCEASSNLARYDGVHYGYRTDTSKIAAELADERKRLLDAGENSAAENLESPLVRMYRKSRSEGFGNEVKRRIMLGTYALSAGYYDAYYLKALKVRRLIRNDYDDAFKQVDCVLGPTAPTPAFKIGQMANDPLALYLQDLFTAGANLAGIAGISVPCGFSNDGLPIGLQLQAAPFEEEKLLRIAQMFQNATDWHEKRPE